MDQLNNLESTKLMGFFGLKRVEIEEAYAGDLIAVSGMEDINVGETVVRLNIKKHYQFYELMNQLYKWNLLLITAHLLDVKENMLLQEKLKKDLREQLHTDVSLRVDNTDSPDAWIVSGRGELHLSILIENMRREGFELQVSKPEVIVRVIDGVRCEPVERVQIDVPEEHTGSIMESMGARKGEMLI